MPWRDFTDPVLDTLRDARDAAFPGGESRSRTVLSGMGLAVVACGLLLLAGLVIFSPGPPSQNVTGSTLPQVVVTSAMTVPTVTIPVTARPPAVTSTTARPSTTTTAVSAPTTIAPATTGHRPATASEAAAVAQEVPPPAGYVITDIAVSSSNPAWAVESVGTTTRPQPQTTVPPSTTHATTASTTAPTITVPTTTVPTTTVPTTTVPTTTVPTTTVPTTTVPTTTVPTTTVPPKPVINLLVFRSGDTWRVVGVGRPLIDCPDAPPSVIADLAVFFQGCG